MLIGALVSCSLLTKKLKLLIRYQRIKAKKTKQHSMNNDRNYSESKRRKKQDENRKFSLPITVCGTGERKKWLCEWRMWKKKPIQWRKHFMNFILKLNLQFCKFPIERIRQAQFWWFPHFFNGSFEIPMEDFKLNIDSENCDGLAILNHP